MTIIHDWDEAGFIAAVAATVEVAEEAGAEMVEKTARNYLSRAKGRGDDVPHMAEALKTVKSKFKDGGYIVGVFDSAPPANWADSVGARAVFYEYGHAAPYTRAANKGHKKRTAAELVTTPKPFLSAALKANRRKIKAMLDEALK